jgi:putative intracellular protease/amidase
MRVYLYVLSTLADWEIGYLTAELHSKRFFRNPKADFQLMKLGLSRTPVESMGGMHITPDVGLDDIRMEKDDMLILPGADTWTTGNDVILQFARDRLEQGFRVAAICGATLGLGRVGALDSLQHTSNDLDFLKATCPAYKGEALYRQAPAVRDGNLVTATGLAPLEFSYEVLGMLDVFRRETLEAWYMLHKTREARHYHALVASMQA